MAVKLASTRRATLVALATALALSGPLPARAQSVHPTKMEESPPPADRIVVEVVTVNGSGCPAGTAKVTVSPDNTAFHVTYSRYRAEAGPAADPTDFRKNCQLNLQIHVPQGFTYAIARADYHGFIHLERGATALQRANYYFQGSSETAHVDHPFAGPLHRSWHATDITDVAALVFAPCGVFRNLNVNTELRVNAGSADPRSSNFMTMDSTHGSVRTTYHFHWRRC